MSDVSDINDPGYEDNQESSDESIVGDVDHGLVDVFLPGVVNGVGELDYFVPDDRNTG